MFQSAEPMMIHVSKGTEMRNAMLLMVVMFLSGAGVNGDEPSKEVPDAKGALQKLQSVVGGWRGVGQVQRGSSKGAWKETAEWVWDLKQSPPALTIKVQEGKQLKGGKLSYDAATQEYVFTGETSEGITREYRGKLEKDRLQLAGKQGEDEEGRVTLTVLNNKRITLLFEKKGAGATGYQRVAEVGYTREGTRLAVEGVNGKECVVTGGEGTIQVSHQGKQYWVCCSGCAAAFEEDPEGILKEYAARVKERSNRATPE